MKALIITLVVLVVLGLAGGTVWWFVRPASANTTTAQATAKIERGSLHSSVSATGRVVSNQDVPIKCKASGTVIQLPFSVSDEVHENDVLLQLDTLDQDRAVAKAKAALLGAEAMLEQSKQDLVVAKQTLIISKMKADANLLAAQAKQKDAAKKFERTKLLLTQKLASEEDYDTAETTAAATAADTKLAEAAVADIKTQELQLVSREKDIKQQEANVEQNRINLDIQKQQLDYATVRSPVTGVVSSLVSGTDSNSNQIITRIGSVVQSGTSSVSGGTTVMTLSDLSRIFVYASVDESDIGRVEDPQLSPTKTGQMARITADAYRGPEFGEPVVFEGRVVRVATTGKNVSNVVTYEVQIEVTSPNKRLLKPEMTTNVEIITAARDDVPLLPVSAFVKEDRGRKRGGTTDTATATAPASEPAATESATTRGTRGKPLVAGARTFRPQRGTVQVVLGDGQKETRNVVVGVTDGNNYEVLEGLAGGETVVVNKSSANSKWAGQQQRPNMGPMGPMGGGGGPRR